MFLLSLGFSGVGVLQFWDVLLFGEGYKVELFRGLFILCACLHLCMCTMCGPDTDRGQKMESDSPELELQKVVSHLVGVGELNPDPLEQ